MLASYFEYYHGSRTHLSLGKDAPDSREVESPHHGKVVALPKVGGLHHHYTAGQHEERVRGFDKAQRAAWANEPRLSATLLVKTQ
jgi:hypothetical protein